MGYIYKITNDINNKLYIGQTSLSLEQRFSQHLKRAGQESSSSYPLYNAMKKYGREHFQIELIEEVSSNLSQRERYWIKYYNTYYDGYNATFGGDGATKIDYDLVCSLYLKGMTGIEIANKLHITKNSVYKILKARNIPVLSNAETTKKKSGKKIGQYDKNTLELIQVYNTVGDASKALNKNHAHISQCANGKRATAYGYIWKFIEDEKEGG